LSISGFLENLYYVCFSTQLIASVFNPSFTGAYSGFDFQ
jgi:hypothetical protein